MYHRHDISITSPLKTAMKQTYSHCKIRQSPIVSYSILCCHMPSYSIIVYPLYSIDIDVDPPRSFVKITRRNCCFQAVETRVETHVPHCPSKAWWSISLSTCGAVGFHGTKNQRFYQKQGWIDHEKTQSFHGCFTRCKSIANALLLIMTRWKTRFFDLQFR